MLSDILKNDDFLAQLRGYFLTRDDTPVFQSVILAGVYDIKNLKLKLRPESEHKYNSPWNIAEAFNVDMSLSYSGISEMLLEYEIDHHTGMDIKEEAVSDYLILQRVHGPKQESQKP